MVHDKIKLMMDRGQNEVRVGKYSKLAGVFAIKWQRKQKYLKQSYKRIETLHLRYEQHEYLIPE